MFVVLFGAEGASAQENAAGPEDEVPCTSCDAAGKMICATCKGKGELFRVCPTCKGTGQKACSVCSDDKPAAEARGSGRTPCDECGGRGTLRGGKSCPRCGGQQTLACLTCSQTGLVSCKKLLPDRICPDCGFVGKVKCQVCGGDRRVSAQELAERRRSRPAPGETKAAAEMAGTSDARPTLPATPQTSRARVTALRELDAQFLDVFAQDPTQQLNLLRKQATDTLRQLAPLKDDGAALTTEIGKLEDRLTNVRDRWRSLRALFDDAHRAIEKARSLTETGEQRLLETRGAARATLEKELDEQMQVVLGIAEKCAARLSREEPDFLPREIAAVKSALEPLLEGAEQVLAGARRAEEERKAALAEAKSAQKLRLAAEARRSKAARPRREPAPDTDDVAPSRSASVTSSVDVESDAEEEESGETSAATRHVTRDEPRASRSSALTLVAMGCCLALALGWLLLRRSRLASSQMVEEESPRAIS